jgi:hypothetical protein
MNGNHPDRTKTGRARAFKTYVEPELEVLFRVSPNAHRLPGRRRGDVEGRLIISTRETAYKTKNLRQDPWAQLCVFTDSSSAVGWSWRAAQTSCGSRRRWSRPVRRGVVAPPGTRREHGQQTGGQQCCAMVSHALGLLDLKFSGIGHPYRKRAHGR